MTLTVRVNKALSLYRVETGVTVKIYVPCALYEAFQYQVWNKIFNVINIHSNWQNVI